MSSQMSAHRRIAELESRLAEARARLPKHDPPPALIAEIDDLDSELARLRQETAQPTLAEQIALVQERLDGARARLPRHTIPPALMAEIDALEAELIRLRSQKP